MILFKVIKNPYVKGWADYQKTGSFRQGARWNSAGVPVMYLSSNIQNAMLEIANYAVSPRMANKFYRMAVFEFPSLRLHHVRPDELPVDWDNDDYGESSQLFGDSLLLSKRNDGFVVPSVAINSEIATHPLNEVRAAAYSNVIVNIEKVGVDKVKLIDSYSPVFSQKMFNKSV